MKKHVFPLMIFCQFIFSQLDAQLSILFVDDSADTFMNSAFVMDAFDAVGISYTLFDAQAEAASPDLATMNNYDLLVWHTSSWNQDLYLWNGTDQVNTDLAAYLSGGGNIWLIGNDFLFDVHGSPPMNFNSGSFEYDYLGIESFDVESFTSDNDTGMPFAEPAMNQPISNLNVLDWMFPTLWYADGVSPRPETVPIYSMGGPGYVLEGETCATWYDSGTSIALSYFFDLSLVSSSALAEANIEAVISFFESEIMTDVKEQFSQLNDIQLAPVPASNHTRLSFELDESLEMTISIVDLLGRRVDVLAQNQLYASGQHIIDWVIPSEIGSGLYFVQFRSVDGIQSHPLEIIR